MSEMNSFPKLPFVLNSLDKDAKENSGDRDLVEYLAETKHFCYLTEKTQGLVCHLRKSLGDDGDLRSQPHHETLMELWPLILTDALKKLKENSPKEWDKDNSDVNFSSFFHPGSLGVTELEELLKGFTDFEGMLYGASPDRYRDHVAHVFRVWIIGHALLQQQDCFGGELSVLDMPAPLAPISSDEWECMWAIVALCHDLGYPVQAIEWINQKARDTLRTLGLVHGGDLRFAFSQQAQPFHDTIIRLMASNPVATPIPQGGDTGDGAYFTHLQNKYYLKFLKSFDNLDHGIVSALLISKSLVYFLEADLAHDSHKALDREDTRQFLIRREILRGMAGHTCPDIYHLHFDSLAFLLILVDEIQCWGRPTLEELQHDTGKPGLAQAEIHSFQKTNIDIVLTTSDPTWSEAQIELAKRPLDNLHRMLRLAVDTKKLGDLYLRFAVKPRTEDGWELLLEDGELAISE